MGNVARYHSRRRSCRGLSIAGARSSLVGANDIKHVRSCDKQSTAPRRSLGNNFIARHTGDCGNVSNSTGGRRAGSAPNDLLNAMTTTMAHSSKGNKQTKWIFNRVWSLTRNSNSNEPDTATTNVIESASTLPPVDSYKVIAPEVMEL